jgi:NitT/TauT family transport system permease protein
VTIITDRPVRTRWSALPRRRPPRPRPAVLSLQVAIGSRATLALTIASIVLPLAVWWLLSIAGWVQPASFLPDPIQAIKGGIELARRGELLDDIIASTRRVGAGFGLAVALSVPLGIFMGSFRGAWTLLEPLMGLLRYLPANAFNPLLMIWLGLEEGPKVALIFLGTFFFNTLMTADVVRQVPGQLVDVSYTLGARTGEVVRKVIIPHSLPGIIDAIRVNAAAAWGFVVVAELLASESGLGHRINLLIRFQEVDKIFAVLGIIGVIGLTVDVGLRVLRDRIGRWTS